MESRGDFMNSRAFLVETATCNRSREVISSGVLEHAFAGISDLQPVARHGSKPKESIAYTAIAMGGK